MAEAIDVAVTLGWALAAWVIVLAAGVTVVTLVGCAVAAWIVRGAWRAVSRRLTALEPSEVARESPGPVDAARAYTEPHAYEETA